MQKSLLEVSHHIPPHITQPIHRVSPSRVCSDIYSITMLIKAFVDNNGISCVIWETSSLALCLDITRSASISGQIRDISCVQGRWHWSIIDSDDDGSALNNTFVLPHRDHVLLISAM